MGRIKYQMEIIFEHVISPCSDSRNPLNPFLPHNIPHRPSMVSSTTFSSMMPSNATSFYSANPAQRIKTSVSQPDYHTLFNSADLNRNNQIDNQNCSNKTLEEQCTKIYFHTIAKFFSKIST